MAPAPIAAASVLDYELELRRGHARASFVMDHGRFGPQGALGGADGAPNEVTVWRNGEAHTPEHLSKEQDIPLQAGDRGKSTHARRRRLWRCDGAGPGCGAVGDVRLGRYSANEAQALFGVVVSGEPPAVDEAETQALRGTKT